MEYTFCPGARHRRVSRVSSRLSEVITLSDRLLRRAGVYLTVLAAALLTADRLEAGSNYKVLHAFAGKPDGGGVFAGVTLDSRGNLYGTTCCGGAYGYGTVFELTPGSGGKWTETIPHNFCADFPRCADGDLPTDGVAVDPAGSLYGVSGVIFQMTHGRGGWGFKVIYGGAAGDSPPNNHAGQCDLLLDAAGNLYGPCFSFGKNYKGAVSELSPGAHGWNEKDLFDFCLYPRNFVCLGGNDPGFRLAWDANGNLYGVTTEGGVNKAGVAYQLEYTADGWKEHVLHSFPASPSDGYNFFGGLALDRSGNVYGTTLQGGRIGAGTVFELSLQQDGHWKETILYDFPNASHDGGGPAAGLVLDQSGNLYGTASGGGDSHCSCGVVFKMTPGSNGKWSYTVLHRFTGTDGYSPQASLTLDSKGNIYGTTTEGGPGGYGVVFEITP
jgi:uncharacterized repeat protein (TIGR03803 family)